MNSSIHGILKSYALCLTFSLLSFASQANAANEHSSADTVVETNELPSSASVDQDYQSEGEISTWVAKAIASSFNIDFVHYRQQLIDARGYYTKGGFIKLLSSLKENGTIDMVRDQSLIISAIPLSAPVVSGLGMQDGQYSWRVLMDVLLIFQSSVQQFEQTVKFEMIVLRQPTSDGLAIESIVFTPK